MRSAGEPDLSSHRLIGELCKAINWGYRKRCGGLLTDAPSSSKVNYVGLTVGHEQERQQVVAHMAG